MVPVDVKPHVSSLGRGAILTGRADSDRLAGWGFPRTKFDSKRVGLCLDVRDFRPF